MSPDSWVFKVDGVDVSVPVHSRLIVNTAEAAIDAAISGVGVTRVLSYQIDQASRAGLLDIALRDFEPAPLPVSLVYAGHARLPLKLRAFLTSRLPLARKVASAI
jgi:DNA-binding transcriptional LysR family regulator